MRPSVFCRVRVLFLGVVGGLSSPSGLVAGAFEPMTPGAAARGYGGAYTAMAVDAWAALSNPAALGYVKRAQLALSAEDLFGEKLLRHNDFVYAHPGLAGGTFGFGWVRLDTVGDANVLDYSENTYSLSYGRGIGRWRWGGSLKYLAVDGATRGSGWGADLAVVGEVKPKKVKLALVVQDVNQPILHWETGTETRIPRCAKVGMVVQPRPSFRISLEENWRGDEDPFFRVGGSFDPYRGRLSLRAGAARSASKEGWDMALGAGIRIKKVTVDMAWTHNDELGDTPTASVLFRF